MLDRLVNFIVKKNRMIEKFFIILVFINIFFFILVDVNYDLSKYLPENSRVKHGIDLMKEEFGYPGSANVMIDDVSLYEARLYKKEIEGIEGVDSVTWADSLGLLRIGSNFVTEKDLEDYYRNRSALMTVSFIYGDSDTMTYQALHKIQDLLGDKGHLSGPSVENDGLSSAISAEVPKIMIFVVLVILLILTLTTTSWLEPVLFMSTMFIGIILNLGSNIIFGEISFLSFSVAAILQMAVSMDYSIFLLHSFNEESAKGLEPEEAMCHALKNSISSITASALTTFMGFIALALMQFTIGRDMGLVLAKGIICSMLTVLVLMPSLILRMNRIIRKTSHRSFIPSMKKASEWIFRLRLPIALLIGIIIVPCYFAQGMNHFLYGNGAIGSGEGTRQYEDKLRIDEVFEEKNAILAIVPNTSPVKEKRLADRLDSLPYVDSVTSLSGLLPAGIPERFIPDGITGQLHSNKYARIIANVKSDSESDYAFSCADEIRDIVNEYYPTDSYIIGSVPVTQDMKDSISSDYNKVNGISILCVALVILITFLSPAMTIAVLIPIEFAIFINMAIPYISGEELQFIGFLMVSSMQLGATVDYAILLTSNYIDIRQSEKDKNTAAKKAIEKSIISILTSGMILTVVGYGLRYMTTVATISSMGELIGRGALMSMALVLGLLPFLLTLFDSFIMKDRRRAVKMMNKTNKMMNKTNKMKTAIVTLLLIFLIVPASPAWANPQDESAITAETTTTVNMRSGPSTDDGKITTLAEKTAVIVLEMLENGWSRVYYGEREGYIKSEYLQTKEDDHSYGQERGDEENEERSILRSNLEPVTDETAYITLSFNGAIQNVSIVKAVDLHGNQTLLDHGSYSAVTNMTTLDDPIISENTVSWQFKEKPDEKFYYEVIPKNKRIDLPWSIAVNYTLNGVPVRGEELAGAEGLVEAHVSVESRRDCSAYFRQNFILMAMMLSDMEDAYSFESPGAQFQTFGTYQAAAHVAMPGQDEEFSYRIGTTSFETPGIFFIMVPATLSQLDDIAEMNEHKENIENAGEAMDKTFDDILSIVTSMSAGLGDTAQGLDRLNNGREIIAGFDTTFDTDIDTMLAALESMREATNELSSVLGNSSLTAHMNRMGDKMSDSLSKMDNMVEDLQDASDSLKKVKKLLKKLQDADDAEKKAILEEIRAELNNLIYFLKCIDNDGNVNAIQELLKDIQDILDELQHIDSEAQKDMSKPSSDGDGSTADGMDAVSDHILKSAIQSMMKSLDSAGKHLNNSLDDMDDAVDDLCGTIEELYGLSADLDPILNQSGELLHTVSDSLSPMNDLILHLDIMLDMAGSEINSGAQLSLTGMAQMLRSLTEALKKTDDIQANKDILSDIIRDEWDRLDEDLGILDIDTKAVKHSFTSEKNAEPRSLQIIMRTASIETEDPVKAAASAENEEDDSIWSRISRLFVKIGSTLVDIFS